MDDGITYVEMPDLSPRDKARLDIMSLAHDQSLVGDCMVGGPTPPEMEAENERLREIYRQRYFDIIARHGVFDEYLAPLLRKEAHLDAELKNVRKDILELRKRSTLALIDRIRTVAGQDEEISRPLFNELMRLGVESGFAPIDALRRRLKVGTKTLENWQTHSAPFKTGRGSALEGLARVLVEEVAAATS